MDVALAAPILYAAVVSYLAGLRVPWPVIGRIMLLGLKEALVLAITLGAAYFLFAPERPAEIIAVCLVIGLLFAAAYLARDWILGTITPAAIVLLNIAANLAPSTGPMPINFLWLANFIPVPYGVFRVALNLLVLYWPALVAIWMLHRGPPGNPVLRLVLGIWVCWVGIAAMVGPGWELVKGVSMEASPAVWIGSAVAAYAVIHSLMLAISLVLAVGAGQVQGDYALSIARSVRVDGTKPWLAAGCGIAFWGAAYVVLPRVEEKFEPEILTGGLIAAAFALGSLLAFLFRVRAPDDKALERSASGMAALVTAVAVFGGFVAFISWTQRDGRPQVDRLMLSPATGTTGYVETVYPMFIRYPDERRQRRVRELLERADVPYTTTQKDGAEHLVVGGEHLKAVLKILETIKTEAGVPPR